MAAALEGAAGRLHAARVTAELLTLLASAEATVVAALLRVTVAAPRALLRETAVVPRALLRGTAAVPRALLRLTAAVPRAPMILAGAVGAHQILGVATHLAQATQVQMTIVGDRAQRLTVQERLAVCLLMA